MPRAPVATFLSLSRRRCYAAAAAAGTEVQQRAPAAMAARVVSGAEGGNCGAAAASKEISWMRHPTTGCWVPEDRFADVDAAELRARLLARKD